MKSYRVYFDRKHGTKRDEPFYMDIYAKNQKDACEHILEIFYFDSYNGYHFYPFHRKAKRIDPNSMCHGLRHGTD